MASYRSRKGERQVRVTKYEPWFAAHKPGAFAVAGAVALGATLACGGGTSPAAPIKLEGCESWPDAPVDADGPAPTLADVLDHTPPMFVGGIGVAHVHVRLGDQKGYVPQLRPDWPPDLGGPLDVFLAAKPFHSDGEDGLFLVIEVQGDTDRGALLGRSAEVGIRLGDALVEFSPSTGSFDAGLTLPGVTLRPGDPVEYVLSGSQLLTSSVSGTLATTWDGAFPIVLADGPNRMEVRALRGADREALLKDRLVALDAAFATECDDAYLDIDMPVSGWSIRHGDVKDHVEDVASIAGWSDPRIAARERRQDVIDRDWTTHLAAFFAEVEPSTGTVGTRVGLRDGGLVVTRAVECAPDSTPGRGPFKCEAALTYDGNEGIEDDIDRPILLATGEVMGLDSARRDDNIVTLTWTGKAPAEGTTVLYRPYGAAGWLRLR